MASSPFHIRIVIVFAITSLISTTASISIPLSPFTKNPPTPSDPYQAISNLVSSSLTRANHLKNPNRLKTTPFTSSLLAKAPLFVHSYGGYSVPLSFGTPPQSNSFVFDTGSSLVWFPCTSHYLCNGCKFPNIDPKGIPTFIPRNSSSSRIVACRSPKCSWIFGPGVGSACKDPGCPPYIIQYGLGSTAGILISDTLDFNGSPVPDFLVGCSVVSNRQPGGIAGFGRGPQSLPSQMRLKKFSYCLVSRRFDDTNTSSDLVLDTGSDRDSSKTLGLSYTPFRKNPNMSNAAFQEYYYVNLRRIIVGGKRVKIPYKFLTPDANENGGTIVDSGSTFTFMDRPIYDAVGKEFATQLSNFTRATEVENQSGLSPCFDISGADSITVPELVFEFKGGAKMALPSTNYFALVGHADVVCLTVVSHEAVDTPGGRGPAIILGNFQQQNYHIEFDLANDRYGFVRRRCD